MTTGSHRLATMLEQAAEGSFPAPDGTVSVTPPVHDTHAVVSFSAHSVLLTDRSADDVSARAIDACGGSMQPRHLLWLAGDRNIGSLDVVMAHRAGGERTLDATTHLVDHPRVARATAHRRDVTVLANERGLVTVGRGLVDRWEVSVELFDGVPHGRGAGRALIAAGLSVPPAGEWLWAQVAAGNTASLRAFLGAGFVPVCSEVLLTHHGD